MGKRHIRLLTVLFLLHIASLHGQTASSAGGAQGGLRGGAQSSTLQGYRLGELLVIGARAIPNEILKPMLGLKAGEIYDESKLRKGFEDLKRFYGQQGYAAFLPQPIVDVDEQRKIVNLTVRIDEGERYFLHRISFAGNTTIPDEVIRREIALSDGYYFNSQTLELSRVRLNQLGLFEEIKPEDFQITLSPTEPVLDVVLKVKEKRQ